MLRNGIYIQYCRVLLIILIFRMLNKNTPYIIILIFSLIFISCEERYELEIDELERSLVVFGEFTTDTTIHYISLSISGNYSGTNNFETVSNATVKINNFILTENDTILGLYETQNNIFAIERQEYTLYISDIDIDNDGENEIYFAKSTVAELPKPDSINLFYEPERDFWQVLYFALDPPAKNYYLFKKYNNQQVSQDISEWDIFDDNTMNGIYWYGLPTLHYLTISNNEEITIQVSSISEEYFMFIQNIKEIAEVGQPIFGAVPGNITNLSSGAVGFFSAHSVNSITTF